MSNDQHDQDDWSPDAAALFRDARRAHDPTSAELASIDAIYARIRSSAETLPPAMAQTAVSATRGVPPRWLRPLANRFAVVVLVAAGSFGIFRGLDDASGPADQTASRAAPAPASPPALEPSPTGRTELSQSQPTAAPEATRPDESRSRGHDKDKPRSPTNVASRRTMVRSKASVLDAHTNALANPGDVAISATTPSADATHDDSAESLAPAALPAPVRDTAPRTAPESDAQATPARKPDPPQPVSAPSELTLLKHMHEALRASDFATALRLCAEHERRWPHGTFELEREGVRAIASCGANTEDAARRASMFLDAHPHAPLAMRVKSFCVAKSKR